MALNQINQDPGSPPKKSKLEYFSQGLDMAQSIASTANSLNSMKGPPKADGMLGGNKTALQNYNNMQKKKNPMDVGYG